MSYDQHFAKLAQRYDALRRNEATDEQADRLIAAGGLAAGQALIDIGCGTGAMTALLVRRSGVEATGVDASEEMLEVARSREGEHCRFVHGRAEELPFAEGSFDRALMKLVIHLVDRPRALAEARRVLRHDGALVISTLDPESMGGFWLADWFPSYADIDRGRVPAPEVLVADLREAGFARVQVTSVPTSRELPREHALEMIRGRFASSFAHIGDAEYEAGLARAERELPETVVSELTLLELRCDTR